MYRVVMGKMVEYNITYEMLARKTGKSVKVLKEAIEKGTRPLRLTECFAIRDAVEPGMTIDELFKSTEAEEATV